MEEQLECQIELITTDAGDIHLAFLVRNTGEEKVSFMYFEPFCDFELEVRSGELGLPLIQPLYDTGIRPVRVTLAEGIVKRIETPIYIRFDPDVGPAGGDEPTRWSIRHVPMPVVIEARVRLGDETLFCRVDYSP